MRLMRTHRTYRSLRKPAPYYFVIRGDKYYRPSPDSLTELPYAIPPLTEITCPVM